MRKQCRATNKSLAWILTNAAAEPKCRRSESSPAEPLTHRVCSMHTHHCALELGLGLGLGLGLELELRMGLGLEVGLR